MPPSIVGLCKFFIDRVIKRLLVRKSVLHYRIVLLQCIATSVLRFFVYLHETIEFGKTGLSHFKLNTQTKTKKTQEGP